MPLLKKTLLCIFFALAMYFGGSTTQSSSNLLQGMGFMSIVLALISFYIIYRLILAPLSGRMRLIIVIGVIWYCCYSLDLFNGNTVSSLVTGEAPPAKELSNTEEYNKSEAEQVIAEMFSDGTEEETAPVDVQNNNSQPVNVQKQGILQKLKGMFSSDNQKERSSFVADSIIPFDYPAIKGDPRVITGSLLRIRGLNIKLFGIDAPDRKQTCADHFGNSYSCGAEAVIWLQNWLNNREVTCHILGDIENSWATGSCFVEDNKYDVAAVVVNAGWAVAYTQNTKVYVPYEKQARENSRGLWQGTFYKPWDWRKIQNRRIEVKIKDSGSKKSGGGKKGGFDFWGLF